MDGGGSAVFRASFKSRPGADWQTARAPRCCRTPRRVFNHRTLTLRNISTTSQPPQPNNIPPHFLRLELDWTAGPNGMFSAKLPYDSEPFKSLYVAGERYWPARFPNGNPYRDLYPSAHSFDCVYGDDLAGVDGKPWSGANLTDLCQAGGTAAGVECNRPNTHFPDSPWMSHGWACRFANCQACADYGDHNPCVHGAMASPHFNVSMAHPEEAAVHVLHDGSWGGWGFNVEGQDGEMYVSRWGVMSTSLAALTWFSRSVWSDNARCLASSTCLQLVECALM